MTTTNISDVQDAPKEIIGVDPEEVKRAIRREKWLKRLPLLPALIFTIIVTQVPFVIALWYSLNDWNLLIPDSFQFIGLDNYGPVFQNRIFRQAILNTIWTTSVWRSFAPFSAPASPCFSIASSLANRSFERSSSRHSSSCLLPPHSSGETACSMPISVSSIG